MNDDNWGDGKYENVEYTDDVPHRLRRNKIDGVIGGVCSGIGDYTGLDPIIVRIATVIAFFVTGSLIFWLYIGLWIFVPKDQRAPYRREHKSRKEQKRVIEAAAPRGPAFRDVKSKFRSLEARLADMERAITSSDWQLRRDFKDLER